MEQPIELAQYLFTRLQQVGVRGIHGVPGDFNLVALDYVEKAGLKWVGNCNELNAGYAADGYAQVNGIGAIVTTFGVGELSAINALAGSYAEYVSVVHVVGVPSTVSQRNGMVLHHTLGNGDFRVFADMYEKISVAQANLTNPATAPELIDHCIRECYIQSRPVYIQLPSDMAMEKVEGALLRTPIDLSDPVNDPEVEDYIAKTILNRLYEAKSPAILVDAGAHRHRILNEVDELIRLTNLPTFIAPMGKGNVNETLPNFCGVYAGDGSRKAIRDYVDSSDLVLTIGNVKTDINTAGFSYRISRLSTVDLHNGYVQLDYARYDGLYMKSLVRKLIAQLDAKKLHVNGHVQHIFAQLKAEAPNEPSSDYPTDLVTHEYLWPRMSSWLQPHDILLTETGTSSLGIWETQLPEHVMAISQSLWSSIGYTLGSAQGAALAAQEAGTGRRTILFEGDGSFQMTAQEISTMIRHKLRIIVFLIANEGYTIERWIHGIDAVYNDTATWRYKDFPVTVGAQEGEAKAYCVKTRAELETLLADEEFNSVPCLQFVELHMPKMDAPLAIKLVANAAQKNNRKNSIHETVPSAVNIVVRDNA
ncbi:MAG: hypothetical protein M1819_000602 [Sarea resinae]|nr:MAG: hypothetical protein M1819_000602 [Sarea resinae]